MHQVANWKLMMNRYQNRNEDKERRDDRHLRNFLARLGRPIPGPFGHHFAPFGMPFMSTYSIDNLMNPHPHQHPSPPTPPTSTPSAPFFQQQSQQQAAQQHSRDQHVDASKG